MFNLLLLLYFFSSGDANQELIFSILSDIFPSLRCTHMTEIIIPSARILKEKFN